MFKSDECFGFLSLNSRFCCVYTEWNSIIGDENDGLICRRVLHLSRIMLWHQCPDCFSLVLRSFRFYSDYNGGTRLHLATSIDQLPIDFILLARKFVYKS